MSADLSWPMLEPAMSVAEAVKPLSDGKLPTEVLRLASDVSSIVMDIGGTDYILTMQAVPRQRERPTTN